MEDEEGQKTEGNAPRKSRTGDDRGDVLFIFRPSYHFLRILGWVIMAVIIISYTALFLGSFASEPDFLILMLGTLAIFPFFLFVLYMSYLAAFDNIVVYEYGLVPPLVSEGSINMFFMRRTYIPFSSIGHCLYDSKPHQTPSGFSIISEGKIWLITGTWDLHVLIPIIEVGIREGYLMPPTELGNGNPNPNPVITQKQ